MRINALLPFLLFLVFALPLSGQPWRTTPYEIYGGIGSVNYFGDIGGSADENTWHGIKDLDIKKSRPGIIGGVRYIPGDYLAFNGSLAMGWLSGNDGGGKNEGRDYEFHTFIFEPSARMEFFAVKDYPMGGGLNRRGLVRNYATLSVYIYGGMGALIYNVRANENLEARQIRDNIDHGPVTMVIPAGLGAKIGISNTTDIGFEIGRRYGMNDYLDGFTSDSSTANDIYYITSVQLVFRVPELSLRL